MPLGEYHTELSEAQGDDPKANGALNSLRRFEIRAARQGAVAVPVKSTGAPPSDETATAPVGSSWFAVQLPAPGPFQPAPGAADYSDFSLPWVGMLVK